MSDDSEFGWFFLFIAVILIAVIVVDEIELSQLRANHVTEVTELKQQLKDSKVHADVKFEACMSQLRGNREHSN